MMTAEEKKRVVDALMRAKTAEEVRRLERMLAEGLIPDGETVEGVSAETNGTAIEAYGEIRRRRRGYAPHAKSCDIAGTSRACS